MGKNGDTTHYTFMIDDEIIQWDNFMRHHAHRIQSLTPSPSHPLPSRLRHASRGSYSYTCMEGRAVLMG